MGQMAIGVLYGCKAPEFPDDEDGEAKYAILDRWRKYSKEGYDRDTPKVRVEIEGGTALYGVWVACGGSGEDGAPYFVDECFPLHQFAERFGKAIARATKLWNRFAKYVEKKEGIVLPQPTLWLTPCEVA